jgi:inorganic pyrophosphatase
LSKTPGKLDPDKVHLPKDEDLSPAPVDEGLDEWFYIDREAVLDEGVDLPECDLQVTLHVG